MSLGLFVGVLVVLTVLGIVFNLVLKTNLPFFQIIVVFVFIYVGAKIFMEQRGFDVKREHVVMLHREVLKNPASGEYNVMFGGAVFDLRSLDLKGKIYELEINSVFANTVVKFNRTQPVKVQADTLLGAVAMPNQSATGLGTAAYATRSYSEQAPHVTIKAHAIFGRIAVE